MLSTKGLPSTVYVVAPNFISDQVARYGAVGAIARPLYRTYALAFELTSVLLLVAIGGAVTIGRRKESTMLAESLALSAVLFSIGVVGVLTRRNAIIIFMCVELMLNAVNLTFVALSRAYGMDGQVFVVFVMTVCRG